MEAIAFQYPLLHVQFILARTIASYQVSEIQESSVSTSIIESHAIPIKPIQKSTLELVKGFLSSQ